MNSMQERKVKEVKKRLDDICLAKDLLYLNKIINYLQNIKYVFSVWQCNNVDKKFLNSLTLQIINSINLDFKKDYIFNDGDNYIMLFDNIIKDLTDKGNEIILKKIQDKEIERMMNNDEKF